MSESVREIGDQLRAHIEASLDKHEIRRQLRHAIYYWFLTATGEVDEGIIEGVEKGFMEIVGWDRKAKSPLFSISVVGEKHVQWMLERGSGNG